MTAALEVEARSFCHLQCKLGRRLVEAGNCGDEVVMRMELQMVEEDRGRIMTMI